MVSRLIQIARSDKSIVLLDQAIVSGGNFLVSILLARGLGLELFGQYSVVWLIFFLFLSIIQAFVIQPLYTLAHKKYSNDEEYIPALQTINLLLILLSTGIFGVTTLILGYTGKIVWLQMIALLFYLLNQELRGVGFYKQMRVRVLLSDLAIQLVLVLGIAFAGNMGLEKVFMLLSGAYGIAVIAYSSLLKFSFSPAKIREVAATHFRFSRWLLVTSGVQWLSGNYLIIVADAILGHAVTGIIRIIQNTLGVFNILLQAMENYVPLKASLIFKENGLKPTVVFIRHIGIRVFSVMLVGLVLFYFFYEDIFMWCYQVTFSDNLLILIFCLLYVFILAGFLLRFLIRTVELNFSIFLGYLISTGITFIIANPIVTHWGVMGVAIGFLITQIVSVATYFFYIQKTTSHESYTHRIR